ncbi:SVM family protein [Candidatus Phytoplasma prunorum]|uniref:SVM family protein n=1 Tax=Candidatus Phytoplasma prunorum TaxID=47565 RepID=UPI002FF06B19
MNKLKKPLYLFKIFLFIGLWLFLITNNNPIIGMKKQKSYIDKKLIDMRLELFNLLTIKIKLVENINDFRNKNKLNRYDKIEIIKLEKEYIEIKQKISEIEKNISKKSKKITFNLKPLIKIIE